jgi:hypothetical protein
VVLVNGLPDVNGFCERLLVLEINGYVVRDESDSSMGLRDLHGDFFALYGLKRNFVCLIRPDRHVEFLGRPSESAPQLPGVALRSH